MTALECLLSNGGQAVGFNENRDALKLALANRGQRQGADKAMFLREGAAGRLSVKDFTAPTGIGLFDACYDPATMEYKITVRVKFNFISPDQEDGKTIKWDQASKDAYRRDTIKVVKDAWSGRYAIRCTREGWEDLSAQVVIDVADTALSTDAHFQLDAKRLAPGARSEGGGVAWSKQPPTIDVDSMGVQPKYTQKLQENIFNMRERMMKESLVATKSSVIQFAHNSSSLQQSELGKLAQLASALTGIIKPDVKGLKVYVYGSTSGFAISGRAKARADAVCNWLRTKVPNGAEVFESVTSLNAEQKAAALKSLQAHYNDPTRTKLSLSGCVLFVATPANTKREAETNYIVMVHEFGHVLGLPDEYTGRLHPRIAATKPLASVMPDTMQEFNRMSGLSTNQWRAGAKRKDIRLAHQQGGFARTFEEHGNGLDMPLFTTGEALASEADAFNKIYTERESEIDRLTKLHGRGAGQVKAYQKANPAPEFPTVLGSSSIMATGMDILPAHYLPIWSSLAMCTGRYLSPADWRIDPTPLKG